MVFAHEGRFVLNIPYGEIRDMQIKEKVLVFRRRKVLALVCGENGRADWSRVWLMVNDVRSLVEWLCRMTSLPLREETVHEIVSRLGKDGEALGRYLSKSRHGTTKQLARLLGVASAGVSSEIEGEINKVAQRVMGRDLMTFKERWFDPETGECIRNSWWLTSSMECISSTKSRVM